MWSLAFLLLGLVGLALGTGVAVRGAVALASRWGVSEHFVGLTVLAIGTDLPELFVAIMGGVEQLRGVDTSGVVLGNAVGSAITQGSLVLGVAGLATYLHLAPRRVRRDGGVLFLAIGILALTLLDGSLGRVEGALLILAYLVYLVAVSQMAHRAEGPPQAPDVPVISLGRAVGLTVLGVAVVLGSAHLTLVNAVSLAESWGMRQTVLGAVVIALGTSLPELALSFGAALRKKPGLSIGNILGSNIFDLLIPTGVAAVIHPLTVDRTVWTRDLPFLAFVTAFALFLFHRKRGLQRREAGLLIALYVLYSIVRIGLN